MLVTFLFSSVRRRNLWAVSGSKLSWAESGEESRKTTSESFLQRTLNVSKSRDKLSTEAATTAKVESVEHIFIKQFADDTFLFSLKQVEEQMF